MTVPEVGEALGLGRSAAYEAVRRGELPSLAIGRRRLVPTGRLLDLLGIDVPSDDGANQKDPPMTNPPTAQTSRPSSRDRDLTDEELDALLAQAPDVDPLPDDDQLDRWAAEDLADSE